MTISFIFVFYLLIIHSPVFLSPVVRKVVSWIQRMEVVNDRHTEVPSMIKETLTMTFNVYHYGRSVVILLGNFTLFKKLDKSKCVYIIFMFFKLLTIPYKSVTIRKLPVNHKRSLFKYKDFFKTELLCFFTLINDVLTFDELLKIEPRTKSHYPTVMT